MRGFVLGSVGLLALSVVVKPRAGQALGQGRSWFISGLRRFLSPDVAGIPQRKAAVS